MGLSEAKDLKCWRTELWKTGDGGPPPVAGTYRFLPPFFFPPFFAMLKPPPSHE
jgi:hypothetical protein